MFIDVNWYYPTSIVAATARVCESVSQAACGGSCGFGFGCDSFGLGRDCGRDVGRLERMESEGEHLAWLHKAPEDKKFQSSKSDTISRNSGWFRQRDLDSWNINISEHKHRGVLLMSRWNFQLQKRSKVYEASDP